MGLRSIVGLLGAMLIASSVANADTRVFARAGAWEAFGGSASNGRPLCGISSRGPGKYFGLKYFAGNSSFTVQLGSDAWRVRTGARQRVMLQFDWQGPWNGIASGIHFNDDSGLEFGIRRVQLDQFIREFRNASELLIQFPESNASGWRANLRGTDAIIDSLVRCIRMM